MRSGQGQHCVTKQADARGEATLEVLGIPCCEWQLGNAAVYGNRSAVPNSL